MSSTIKGFIIDANTRKGIANLTIEAWEQDVKVPDLIGKVVTDANGRFEFTFDESYWKDNYKDLHPIVFFRVFDASGKLLRDTHGEIYWTEKQGTNEIIIPVVITASLPTTMENTISGQVLNEWNRGIADAYVKLSQITGPGETQLLAAGKTDCKGRFSLVFSQLAKTKNCGTVLFELVFRKNAKASQNEVRYEFTNDQLTAEITARAEQKKWEGGEWNWYTNLFTSLAPSADYGAPETLSWLHKMSGVGVDSIQHYATAKQLNKEFPVDASYLYAWLRKGLTISDKTSLASHNLENLQGQLESAESEFILKDYKKLWGAFVKIWTVLQKRVENERITELLERPVANTTTLKNLLQIATLTDDEQKRVAAFQMKNEFSTNYWAALESELKLPKKKIDNLKEVSVLNTVFMGNAVLINSQLVLGSKKLAELPEAAWTKLLGGQKEFLNEFPGENIADKRKFYLNSIYRELEQLHPMPFFKARVAENKKFKRQESFVSFLESNPQFEFGKQSVSNYLRKNKKALSTISPEERVAFSKSLQLSQVQYLSAAPGERTQAVTIMQEMKLTSMTDVIDLGSSFSSRYQELGGSASGAQTILGNVQIITSFIVQAYAGLKDQTNLPMVLQSWLADDLIADANLQELFGSQDGCACKHCRSIYSPAAYLTDALHYLEKDNLIKGAKTPYSFLTQKGRRSDIPTLLLNCENANTPMPYIDIVNEVLLNSLNIDHKIGVDTKRKAEELAAYPVFENNIALDSTLKTLKESIFPFQFPFDYHRTIADQWWKQVGTSKTELITTFNQNATNIELCKSTFGISDQEWLAITTDPTGRIIENENYLWGGSFPAQGKGNVKDWLNKTGLSLEDFTKVINTAFVNKTKLLQIYYFSQDAAANNIASCDLDEAQFTWYQNVGRSAVRQDITSEQRKKIYTFIRLWKKLNWSIEELDLFISNLSGGEINEPGLENLFYLSRLAERWKCQPQDLLSLWESSATEFLSARHLFFERTGLSFDQVEDMKTWGIPAFSSPFVSPENTLNFVTKLGELRQGGFDYFELKYLLKNTNSPITEDILKKMPSLRKEDAQKLTHLFLESKEKRQSLMEQHNIDHLMSELATLSTSEFKEDDKIRIQKILISRLPEGESEIDRDEQIVTYYANRLLELSELFKEEKKVDIQRFILEEIGFFNFNYILHFIENEFKLPINGLHLLLADNTQWMSLTIKELGSDLAFESIQAIVLQLHKVGVLFASLPNLQESFYPVYTMVNPDINSIQIKSIEEIGQYSQLFKQYPNVNEKDILKLIHADSEGSDWGKRLVNLFEWSVALEEVKSIQHLDFRVVSDPLASFLNFHKIIQLLQKTCLPLNALNISEVNSQSIETLQSALKQNLSKEQWLKQCKAIYDPVRESLRDALVAHLLNKDPRFHSEDDLYKHFLLDTQMSACTMTSRILQAILSVQLFVQRCLMNLESGIITLENEDWKHWEWMKQYRVWEANRKVFAYPENWIEPELRDDKTEFFAEMENELLQNEMTSTLGETALQNYVHKLESVANLEIMAMCRAYEINNAEEDSYYIFGRTYGLPQQLYFRKYVKSKSWTGWQKIELDIEGDHLVPVVHQGKLHLFWPMFKEKALKQSHTVPIAGAEIEPDLMYWEIQMAWSLHENGKWGAKKISNEIVSELESNNFITYQNLHQRKKKMQILFKDNVLIIKSQQNTLVQNKKMQRQEIQSFSEYKSEQQIINQLQIQNANFDYSIQLGLSRNEYYEFEIYIVQIQRNGDLSQVLYNIFFTVWPKHSLVFKPLANLKFNGMSLTRQFSEVGEALQFNSIFENNRIAIADDRYVFFNDYHQFISSVSSGQIIVSQDQSFSSEEDNIDMLESFYNGNLRAPFIFQDSGSSFLMTLKNNRPTLENLNFGSSVDLIEHHFSSGWLQSKVHFGFAYRQLFAFQYSFNRERIDISQIEPQTTNLLIQGHPGSIYNWEILFHTPMYIAGMLSKNNRYEEAQKWYHLVFNPTVNSEDGTSARYWLLLPFKETYHGTAVDRPLNIIEILRLLNDADNSGNTNDYITNTTTEVANQIDDWRDNSFEPHRIARVRVGAYMKNVVMKYIDNLIAWGDELFRQDTMESNNEATQLYMLAWEILGGKPYGTPGAESKDLSYEELKVHKIDEFSNVMVELEERIQVNVIHQNRPIGMISDGIIPIPASGIGKLPAIISPIHDIGKTIVKQETETILLQNFYFCIPENEKLMEYWNTVSDRFYKLRNCMNINGTVRQLPLYQPPIDPALLVRAKAMGLSIADVMNDINAPLAHYRFNFMISKALEYTQEVKGLAGAFLGALQGKDAEEMTLLRSRHEITMLDTTRQIRKDNIRIAMEAVTSMELSKEMTENRLEYYRSKPYETPEEKRSFRLKKDNFHLYLASIGLRELAGLISNIPSTLIGPFITGIQSGNYEKPILAAASALDMATQVNNHLISSGLERSSINQRWDEWKHQEQQAKLELKRIDKELLSAEIRLALAEQEAENHELQLEQSKEQLDFMKSRFTNLQLYNWMSGELAKLYRQSFEMAYQLAKKAEKNWQFELGIDEQFVKYGHLDSLYKGLMAGEKLMLDLRRMEMAYLERNKRKHEVSKTVSLAMINAKELERLRATGICDIEVPEVLFDLDFPQHKNRRIKSVSITIPAVSGPYTGVNGVLRNKYGSIATSGSQNDAGMFQFNFNDERYLPFEGQRFESTGSEGNSCINFNFQLNSDHRAFDYNTITDILLHIQYTAEEIFGETALTAKRAAIQTKLKGKTFTKLISVKNEFSKDWFEAKSKGLVTMDIDLAKISLPYLVTNIELMAPIAYAALDQNGMPKLTNSSTDSKLKDVAWVEDIKFKNTITTLKLNADNTDIVLVVQYTLS